MLAKTASHVHQQLASGEKLEIAYRCCCDRGDIKNSLTKKLEKNMDRELETGVSMTGPHREDVDIRIGGMSAKSFASQGQQRTAILSIKIACAMLAKKATGDAPVLLLDDVFSELDEKRRNNLVRMTEGFQVFITGTELPGGFKAPEMKLFTVEKGRIDVRSLLTACAPFNARRLIPLKSTVLFSYKKLSFVPHSFCCASLACHFFAVVRGVRSPERKIYPLQLFFATVKIGGTIQNIRI